MGCAQGKCCVPRRQRGRGGGGGGAVGGRGGATLGRVAVPGAGLVLEYATLAVAGLYPDSPGRESQDAHLVATRFAGHPDLHLFAVFDGHGACGAACAGVGLLDTSFVGLSLESLALHSHLLPPSQNKCSFALFMFNV
ncbi:hypothetical protein OsI_27095 [Oryza sativa Indica Group]|uniref:protein-serine/threonine phosphatase n=1 Tax=Oryza sativa subsp. indica TaxID=39946 RepID=B8B560_ORYSI|nr:hypothetical protein OsI_27095 [Oryza sativa Indica Group]